MVFLMELIITHFQSHPRRFGGTVNARRDLGRWQAREQILQIIEGIEPAPSANAQQGVDPRTPFPSISMPNEPLVAELSS